MLMSMRCALLELRTSTSSKHQQQKLQQQTSCYTPLPNCSSFNRLALNKCTKFGETMSLFAVLEPIY